jgi:hypothetical protein
MVSRLLELMLLMSASMKFMPSLRLHFISAMHQHPHTSRNDGQPNTGVICFVGRLLMRLVDMTCTRGIVAAMEKNLYLPLF